MERSALPRLARADAPGRAAGGLLRLRLRLGSLTPARAGEAGLLVAVAGLAGAVFVRLALLRWERFETNAFDLAFFDQIIFNTAHGDVFRSSFIPYNFAGQHFEPVLLLFVPAYRLGAGPPFLLVTQAVVAALAAAPLFLAARLFGLRLLTALSIVAAYLLNPYLHRALAFDFHPEVMVALPAFGAVAAIAARRGRLAVALSLAPLLFKEDAVLVSLALALLMALRGERRPATATAGLAALWTVVVVLVAMPLARQGHPSDLVDRYGYLVNTRSQAALLPALALHPWAIARELGRPAELWTAALFVGITGAAGMLRPKLLLPVAAGLALALLSSHEPQRRLELHYAAELVPLALVAVLAAAPRLEALAPRLAPAAILLPALAGFAGLSPFVHGSSGPPPPAAHREAISAALRLIPDDPEVSVSAQSGLAPRLAHHSHVHEFPSNYADAGWIVVDRYGFRSAQSLDWGYDFKLEYVRHRYVPVFAQDGVEVFRSP